LPDKDKTTQPTLEAIFDRIQGFEARIFQHLESQIALLREEMITQIASLREEMITQNALLREEMNSQFRLVANKIDVLNEDSLGLRASQRDLLKRMGELESRAS
jgi:hypothetical protein